MSSATDLPCDDLKKALLPFNARVPFSVKCALRILTSQEIVRIKSDHG